MCVSSLIHAYWTIFNHMKLSHDNKTLLKVYLSNPGEYSITVNQSGRPVLGCPFHSQAFDKDIVKIGPIKGGTVGLPVEFTCKCLTLCY